MPSGAARRGNLVGCPRNKRSVDQHNAIDEVDKGIHVMHNRDDADAVVANEPLERFGSATLICEVHRGERLVEHENLRIYRQCTRDQHALPLATAEAAVPPIAERLESHRFERRLRAVLNVASTESSIRT